MSGAGGGPIGPGTAVPPAQVVVVGAAGSLRDRVLGELDARLGAEAEVRPVADVGGALEVPDPLAVVVLLGAADQPVATAFDALHADPRGRDAATMLVTSSHEHDDLAVAIDRDQLRSLIAASFRPRALGIQVRLQLARWLRTRDPADPRLAALDADGVAGRALELPRSDLLRDLEVDEDTVTARLVEALDRELGPRPRLRLPPDVRLTHQDHNVDGLYVILRGAVALDRATEIGDLRLHHASTGPVVGLLSLTQQRRAFFTARTTTDVVAIHLSLEQLDRAARTAADVVGALTAASVRALARRLRHSETLQVERAELTRQLEQERADLAAALTELEGARLELVESARFATLGELAAGIAHELNNPVAALTRAADHLAGDLDQLLLDHPASTTLRRALDAARTRPPRSTAEERRLVREVGDAICDRALGRDLVAAGIEDPDEAAALVAASEPARLRLLATSAAVGTSLRNMRTAAGRIADLVESVRAHARPTGETVEVDLAASIDDTLTLLAHRLRGIEVVREFGPLPHVRAHPGQLAQVWGNLLANAAEAMRGEGRIVIGTDRPRPDTVRVRFVDDGPGIAPSVRARLFEPRFTTKAGQVRFGLGLGLAIAKRIVEAHGGTISLRSDERGTTATVRLPVSGPPAPAQRRGTGIDPGPDEEDAR